MCKQNASCLVKQSGLRGKQLKQNLPKNCSKSTKMATTACKFSKIYWGSMSPDSIEPFLFSICFKNRKNSAEKTTLKDRLNLVPPPWNSKYAADMKTFFKELFTSFLGLTSLHLVNIQPNSKFHPPPKIFWIHPQVRDRGFFRTPFEKYRVRPYVGLNLWTVLLLVRILSFQSSSDKKLLTVWQAVMHRPDEMARLFWDKI